MAEKSSASVSDTIDAPISEVWPLVANFGGLDQIMDGVDPYETTGEGVGMERFLPMGGGIVHERLEELAEPNRMAYSIVDSPLPFDDYYAAVDLTDEGERTGITWSSTFVPKGDEAAAVGLAENIYKGGIAGFKKALGS